MDQLRQVLELIQTQLKRLTVSQRLLMLSLAVVAVMMFFVVSQYAGGRTMSALMPAGSTPEAQQAAVDFLESRGIPYRRSDGAVMVPAERRLAIVAQMGEAGAQPDDTTLLFNNFIENVSWTWNNEQTRRAHNIALQNELSRVIASFRGVRSAQVFIDAPERSAIGAATREPVATVTIFPTGGGGLNQSTVDAVANLVAGAKAGLEVESIRVIDGQSRTQHRARSEQDAMASAYFEHATVVERAVRGKLVNLLSYIDGAVVAVSAQVDVRRLNRTTTRVLPSGSGSEIFPVRERSSEQTQREARGGAEPGVRSNAGLDIARAGSGGESFSQTETEAELEPHVGREMEEVLDPRGMPTRINATVNVPRRHFVRMWRMSRGAEAGDEAEPAEEDLTAVMEQEIARLRADIQPLLETPDGDGESEAGEVVVSMIPDPLPPERGGGGGSSADMLGGGQSVLALGSGWVKTLGLGALAVVSLGLMVFMMKKASKPSQLPTAEELAGVPPALATDMDMVGEADEAEAALAGIEMSDDDLQLRKKVEQVSALVKEKPVEAAALLNRWIAAED